MTTKKVKGIVTQVGDSLGSVVIENKKGLNVYKPGGNAFEFVNKALVGKQVEITMDAEKERQFNFIRVTSKQPGDEQKEDVEEQKQPAPEEVVFDIGKYTVDLQGKKYITHQGLLKFAHIKGLQSLSTRIIEYDIEKKSAIIECSAILEDGGNVSHFKAFGDSSTESLKPNMHPHFLGMAQTRAINRCLRLATGLGMTSFEELGDDKGD